MNTCIDKTNESFAYALEAIATRTQGDGGIGTMSEKSVHGALKYYYCPDPAYHEVCIGKAVADICYDGEIYEIQTRQFYRLKNKLNLFLNEYEVTIVYPVSLYNTVCWVEPDTGVINRGRKTKRKGYYYRIFRELYSIRELLDNPRLHINIVCLETEDYRLLDGISKNKKIRATKTDKVPVNLISEKCINSASDIASLIPAELDNQFSADEFSKLTALNASDTSKAMLVLMKIGAINRIGKRGRSFLYERLL